MGSTRSVFSGTDTALGILQFPVPVSCKRRIGWPIEKGEGKKNVCNSGNRMCIETKKVEERICTAKSERICTAKSERICTEKSARICTPKSERISTAKSEMIRTVKSERICTAKSERICTAKSEKICTAKSESQMNI
jgi:hypothetical protein